MEVVALAGETASDNAVLGLGAAEVQARFRAEVKDHPGFTLPSDEEKPRGDGIRVALELLFTRFIQREAGALPLAEVGARVLVFKGTGTRGAEYEGHGSAEVPLSDDTAEGRRAAAQTALKRAMKTAVDSAHLQLVALGKPDDKLVEDLKAPTAAVRDAAVRALFERQHPAAVPPLTQRLHSEDAAVVRRTIGQLVELRDPRAVEPLIDLSRGKNHGFVREIIYAVGALGGDEAEAYLDTVAAGHDQPAVRQAAAEALRELRAAAESRQRGTPPTADNREGKTR